VVRWVWGLLLCFGGGETLLCLGITESWLRNLHVIGMLPVHRIWRQLGVTDTFFLRVIPDSHRDDQQRRLLSLDASNVLKLTDLMGLVVAIILLGSLLSASYA